MNRATFSLDGQWLFQIDRDERGEACGYQRADGDHKGWFKAPVPGNWDTYLPELFGYAGHAWYRRTFRARSAWQGSRIHLRFEGANYETAVWLNGELLGSHSGGFDPFTFDVTERLNWQGENTLAVRVDNWPRVGRVPNSLAGWWNYGGICRSVKLLILPPVRIAGVSVRAEPGEGGSAPLQGSVTLVNEGPDPADVTLAGAVVDQVGPAQLEGGLAAGPFVLQPGEAKQIALAAVIRDARLWSPEDPNLYTLHLALRRGRTTLDSQGVTLGVRRFEVRGTQLYLNNEPIVLAGVDRHEEYAGTGRVDPGGQLEADLRLIKEMNGNIVRMHYQAHPDLYDLADRLGLLVFAEIPLWQVGNKDIQEWSDPGVWRVAETMLRTLIGELQNHPSVVIWSVGNECQTDREEARPLIGHLAQLARDLDGTRPVAYVAAFGPNEKVFDLVDLPCQNLYHGLDMASFAERIERTHALQPGKPLLITEFGHEAVLGLHGEGYGTEDEQALVLEGKWRVLRERAQYVPGGIIWCLADYWHMPMGPAFHWLNRTYFCHGVTTLNRRPKQAVAVVKRMWKRK